MTTPSEPPHPGTCHVCGHSCQHTAPLDGAVTWPRQVLHCPECPDGLCILPDDPS